MDTETAPAGRPPQALNGHHLVDEPFAAALEEQFGIPMAFIPRALKGGPHQPAVALCRLATRYEEPNGTLLMLARRFGRGRARRRRTAGTPPGGHAEVPPRPRMDRSGPGRACGRPQRDGCPLRGACGLDALARTTARPVGA